MPSSKLSRNLTTCTCTGVIIIAASLLFYFIKQRKRDSGGQCHKISNCLDGKFQFVQAGKVEQLYVYPIKSCKGINAPFLDCTDRGSRFGENNDRSFLLVDAKQNYKFLTAREYPRLVLIEPFVCNEELTLKFPDEEETGIETIILNLDNVFRRGDIHRAILFNGEKTDGYDCGDKIGDALTKYLKVEGKRSIRLLCFLEGLYTERDKASNPLYWHNNPVPIVNDKIAYMDLAGYMAFSKGSIEDINTRLVADSDPNGCVQIDARNFRPNIVVSGVPAFDEDRWLRLRIGEAVFICYKPCTRCILTTVNPDTGLRDASMEPLKQLRKYRLAPGKLLELYKNSPIFGVNMALAKPGRISIGDDVEIEYKQSAF